MLCKSLIEEKPKKCATGLPVHLTQYIMIATWNQMMNQLPLLLIKYVAVLDYYVLVNEMDVIIHENEKLSNLLRQAIELNNSTNKTCFDSFPSMLQHLIHNAINNAEKYSTGRRHLEIIKKFATSLFIYTGTFLAAECYNSNAIFTNYSKLYLFRIQRHQ